jgi:hypothetical protein
MTNNREERTEREHTKAKNESDIEGATLNSKSGIRTQHNEDVAEGRVAARPNSMHHGGAETN